MSERGAGALRTGVIDPFGHEREAIVLRVADGSGEVGWGEASPLPGYSPDALDAVEAGLDDWAARWERGEVEVIGELGDDPALDDALADLPAARCAADTALLDLAARRLGVPLYAKLLDLDRPARPVGRVPVAALVTLAGTPPPGASPAGTPAASPAGASTAGTPRAALRAVAEHVAAGYKTVKVKIGGEDFAAELEQLAEIRARFPFLRIRLDANGAWTPATARTRLGELKELINPEFVEQPVGPEDLLSFGNAGVPLAADESVRLPGALDELAGPGGCAMVVLKPMILGGPRACQRLAAAAFGHGMGVIVSHAFGGPIAHAMACELALALAAADPAGAPSAAGLDGHDDLPQRSGPWIVSADIVGHGADGPW